MFYVFMIALGVLLGANSQGYGPEALCHAMGGKYDGTVLVGGNGKNAVPAKVSYCTAGPSTLVENAINGK